MFNFIIEKARAEVAHHRHRKMVKEIMPKSGDPQSPAAKKRAKEARRNAVRDLDRSAAEGRASVAAAEKALKERKRSW